ncbi:isoflavone reductase family protein [Phyllosticta paracitricarpa]|uniref:Isoflavone reductase family protein n=1 Tax=Phyllosticta paracitricarpa TaxID=2016321 RepID=A0ABR1MZD6_9PEZI
MAIVAVAGGSSPTLGHAIVSATSLTPNTPVILSRQTADTPPPDPETNLSTSTSISRATGAAIETRYVDYASSTSLAAALAGVHTVICVLRIADSDEWAAVQTRLLRAAEAAGCKRFAPSEFGFGAAEKDVAVTGAAKERVWAACRASRLECTRFSCGIFMNYLALGRSFASSEAREVALAGLQDDPFLFDFQRGIAELPVNATGAFPRVSFTLLHDVGRFVAAACLLTEGSWLEQMSMVGETMRLDDMVELVKNALGIELELVAIGEEELRRRADGIQGTGETSQEVHRKIVAQLDLAMLDDKSALEPVCNQICFLVKPMGIKEFLQIS